MISVHVKIGVVDEPHLMHIRDRYKEFKEAAIDAEQVLYLAPVIVEDTNDLNTLDFYSCNSKIKKLIEKWVEENTSHDQVVIKKASFAVYAVFKNRNDALLMKLALDNEKLV